MKKNIDDKNLQRVGTPLRFKMSFGIMLMALLGMMVIACNHELDAPTIPPLETGALSASKSEIVIDNTKPVDEAVTFSWTAARNSHIVYKLILTAGSESDTMDLSTAVSKKFSNVELNNVLLDKLHLEIGQTADVNVVVHSKVVEIDDNNKTAESNVITISVTPDNKVEPPAAYSKLWIVGDATPNGWNIGDPNVMTSDPLSTYQFKFNEVLKAGEFKIPVTTGNWGTDYYMPVTNNPAISNTTVKFTPGGNPDNKWRIENAGAYKILLNISTNGFIKITPFTPVDVVYIIGDATAAGWNADNAIAMTATGNPNVFTWTGDLSATGEGQFRFVTTKNLNGYSFVAPSPDASLTATQLGITADGTPANNFKVKAGEEGTYKITLDQFKETISIVKQ